MRKLHARCKPRHLIRAAVGLAAAGGLAGALALPGAAFAAPSRATTSAVTASPSSPSVLGQSVTFTDSITTTCGSHCPLGGHVDFSVDSVLVQDTDAPFNGSTSPETVTYTTSTLMVGTHLVTAVYSGDSRFKPSTGSLSFTVSPASTTTSLSVTPSTSVFGQPVTLSSTVAAVSPSTATPTGSINFFEVTGGPTLLASVSLVSGAASVVLSNPTLGSHQFQAVFVPAAGGSFTASSSANEGLTVNLDPTSLAISQTPNPGVFGSPVTITVNVSSTSPGSGAPNGVVNFLDAGNNFLAAEPLAAFSSTASHAFYTTSSLPVGTSTINASYPGSTSPAGYGPSSTSIGVAVIKANSSLNAAPAFDLGTGALKFKATLTGNSAPLAGQTVTFSAGATVFGTAVTNASGVASLPVPSGTATYSSDVAALANNGGKYTATFGGNGSFNSTSDVGDATSPEVGGFS